MKYGAHTALVVLGVLALGTTLATAQITFDLAMVRDPGNANDSTGFGAVSYTYAIATKEVSLFQYTAFLNAVAAADTYSLYNPAMGSDPYVAGITQSGSYGDFTYAVIGSGNRPVTYVSWFDAARFANWVSNGQPTGAQDSATTENGAYTLNGAMSGVIFTKNEINPNTSAQTTYWIPSEDEWYKAAYYQPEAQGGDTDSYWLYPTGSNTIAGNTIGVANSANYYDGDFAKDQNNLPSYLTDGGAYGSNSASFYGTYDQGGNVWEWNDTLTSDSTRGLRGGPWEFYYVDTEAVSRYGSNPTLEGYSVGFRVASVPEPPTVGLTLLVGAGLMVWKRRSQKGPPVAF